jgi:hypothetical protein
MLQHSRWDFLRRHHDCLGTEGQRHSGTKQNKNYSYLNLITTEDFLFKVILVHSVEKRLGGPFYDAIK